MLSDQGHCVRVVFMTLVATAPSSKIVYRFSLQSVLAKAILEGCPKGTLQQYGRTL